MFREIILPIFRSTRLCVTACGVMHTPRFCRPSAGKIVGCAPWWWPKTETCSSDIYVYFNVNFNVFIKLIKVRLLVTELYNFTMLYFLHPTIYESVFFWRYINRSKEAKRQLLYILVETCNKSIFQEPWLKMKETWWVPFPREPYLCQRQTAEMWKECTIHFKT